MTEDQRKNRNDRARERYQQNPEKYRAIKLAEYRADPEKFSLRARVRRKRFPEKVRAAERERARAGYAKNPEKAAAYQKAYRAKHRELFRRRGREYTKKNREQILAKQRAAYHRCPEKFLQKQRDRYHSDPAFRLGYCIRRRIYNRIRESARGARKAGASIALLGCSFLELKAYIENLFTPGMTWPEVMAGKIHMDHIRPCASFDLTDPVQQRQCFHYTNLQPLWAKDNLAKGDSW